jgi:acyl-CoA dehydrogenase
VGGAQFAAFASGAYCRIRRQFKTSISHFEGIQEVLGRIGGLTYLTEAVRYLTVALIDAGERPTVPGAIAKCHVTELGRKVTLDAMDVHGGKAIMRGPRNYLAHAYQCMPIAITVEGANILTRNMIIFGQGAIRCHPYLLKEMEVFQHQNLGDFEHYLGQHISFTLSNAAQAFFHGVTFSLFANTPTNNASKRYFQQLTRASSAFALVADTSMALLGGKLKFKESLSARLGDQLSMMYILSAILKKYHDEGFPQEDYPLVCWSADYCLSQFWRGMDEILNNFPNRIIAIALRAMTMPFGIPCKPPQDQLNREITDILTNPDAAARTRLLNNVFVSNQPDDHVANLETAFQAVARHSDLMKRVYDAIKNNDIAQGTLKQCIEAVQQAKIITDKEAAELYEMDQLCQAVIAVDDFSAQSLGAESKKDHSVGSAEGQSSFDAAGKNDRDQAMLN